jgi:hypothetical protein
MKFDRITKIRFFLLRRILKHCQPLQPTAHGGRSVRDRAPEKGIRAMDSPDTQYGSNWWRHSEEKDEWLELWSISYVLYFWWSMPCTGPIDRLITRRDMPAGCRCSRAQLAGPYAYVLQSSR